MKKPSKHIQRLLVAGISMVCLNVPAMAQYRAEWLETTKAWGSVVADFNLDGHDDLFVTGHHAEDRIWYWSPTGYVRSEQVFDWVDRHDCDAADVNLDGRPDIYCAIGADRGEGQGTKQLWLQGEDGVFRLSENHGAEDPFGRGRLPIFFDFNGDAYPDLYLTNFPTTRPDGQPNINRVFVNQGGAGFREVITLATGMRGSQCVAKGDVDGDGRDDLLVCYEHGPGHLYLNDRAGDFRELASPALGGEWRDAKLKDVNGDGRVDLVLIHAASNALQVWLNRGTGGFYEAPALEAALPHRAVSLAVADVDRDGRQDIYVVLADSACTSTGRDAAPDLLFKGAAGGGWVKTQLKQNYGGCGHLADVVDGHRILLENGDIALRGPSFVLSWTAD